MLLSLDHHFPSIQQVKTSPVVGHVPAKVKFVLTKIINKRMLIIFFIFLYRETKDCPTIDKKMTNGGCWLLY